MSHLFSQHGLGAIALAAVALASVEGCAAHHSATPGDDDTTLLAQDGSDTSAAENDTETISSSFIAASGSLGLASGADLAGGQLSAANLGDGTRAEFYPAGCLTVTSDPTSRAATYAFDHCSGPYGLLDVTGVVKVTSSPSPATAGATRLVLDFVGTGLKINRATADWSAHAEIASTALGARTMTWRATLAGTTARGRAFTRTNQKTVAWTVGQECVLVNGSSDGNVTGRQIHTDVIHYSRCRGECPAPGSEIRITNANTGKTVDITYDGGRQATFTGPTGGQTQIVLACGL